MTKRPPEAPLRAAIYCRISRDRSGEGSNVEIQERRCRDLAERLGYVVAAVYVDNDISAYSGKARPGYRAMLDAVRRGEVSAIVSWHTDRLHRRLTDLEELVTLAEATAVQIRTVTAGEVDLSTASGRMNARILASVAQKEVEQTRERIQSKRAAMAEEGRYRGGKRPYGYEKDGRTVRTKEAEVVRRVTRDLLAGRSLRSLANELNAAGARTSSGAQWTSLSLRDVIVRPRNAGLIHRGRATVPDVKIVGDALWEPLVDRDTWHAVHALLTDPTRRPKNHTSDSQWLGSGIYRCGRCGGKMRATGVGETKTRPNHKRVNTYRCFDAAHLTITGPQTDRYVREVVAEMLRDPRVVRALTPQGDEVRMQAARERRSVLARQIEKTERDYDEDLIDGRRYRAKVDRIAVEMSEVDAFLADSAQAGVALPVATAPDPGAAFLDAPLDVQRAVLRTVLDIEVLPATGRGKSWSSERLRLVPVDGGEGAC